MSVKVLEIKGKNSYLIKEDRLSNYSYYLNGEEISKELIKFNFIISKDDKFQYNKKSQILVEYRRGDEVMSVEEYKSKPTYYFDDTSDEDVLRRIANKKELEGFEPVCKDSEIEDVDLNVIGFIENTGSNFIHSSISARWSNNEFLYTLFIANITIDEYKKLAIEYAGHAKFQEPDRGYLRFTKINNNYVFGDHYPFCEHKNSSVFYSLDEAKAEEANIRGAVRRRVENHVFSNNKTEYKNIQILSQLKTIKKLKSKKSMDELINVLIKDLQDYMSKVK